VAIPQLRDPENAPVTPDTLAALRQAAEAVRTQIPTGGLTRASVERLLQAAEAACAATAGANSSSRGRGSDAAPRAGTGGKRQEARRRWAEIARQNAQEARPARATAE
jgi:hypothetical protein